MSEHGLRAEGLYRPCYPIHPARSGLSFLAMSSSDRCVRCRIFKTRTVDRMVLSAAGLTAGVKLHRNSLFRRTSDHSWPELISEEVKRDVRIPPLALTILAIDDLGFGGGCTSKPHSAKRA